MKFLDKNVLLLALPGFISLFSANFISDMPEVRDSQLPFVYFILSAISLSIPFGLSYLIIKLRKRSILLNDLLKNAYFLLATLIFSIVVGFGFGVLHTTDAMSATLRNVFGKNVVQIFSHNELVRELFSRAYSDDFPDGRFNLLPPMQFDHSNRYARFSLADGKIVYEGVVEKFFSGSDQPQVYISPACTIHESKIAIVQGPGVWINLTKATDIQFIDGRCSACATKHEELMGREGGKLCPYTK